MGLETSAWAYTFTSADGDGKGRWWGQEGERFGQEEQLTKQCSSVV